MVMTLYTYESEPFQNMEKFVLNEIKFSQENGYSPRAKRHMKRQLLREMNNVKKMKIESEVESESEVDVVSESESETEVDVVSESESDDEVSMELTFHEYKCSKLTPFITFGYFVSLFTCYLCIVMIVTSKEEHLLYNDTYNSTTNTFSCIKS